MMKTPLFIRIFVLIIIIATLHFSALQFYLYWRLWWFDSLVHFFSGFWVAIFFLWLFFQFGHLNFIRNKRKHNLIVAILSSVLIGIGWEIFEYNFGIAFVKASNYASDTVTDVSFDLIGGFISEMNLTSPRLLHGPDD